MRRISTDRALELAEARLHVLRQETGSASEKQQAEGALWAIAGLRDQLASGRLPQPEHGALKLAENQLHAWRNHPWTSQAERDEATVIIRVIRSLRQDLEERQLPADAGAR